MSFSKVQSALFQCWIDNDEFELETFYPNRDYKPIQEHARLFFLPAASDIVSLGLGGYNRISGVFQVTLCFESGLGNGRILEKADEIMAVFRSGLRLEYENQQCTIWTSAVTQPADIDGWLQAFITINFTAETRRQT